MTHNDRNGPEDRTQEPEPGFLPLPASPWVLVDQATINDTAMLLERLVVWLRTGEVKATIDCARALSLGEDEIVDNVETWADALAGRLLACAQGGAA